VIARGDPSWQTRSTSPISIPSSSDAVYLPTATVTLTPEVETLGPTTLSVVADPDASSVDVAGATVPAERLSFGVRVDDEFPATGVRVEESQATGEVTFSSLNTGGPNQIAAGAIVSTEGGIRFRTTAGVTLPAAQLILGIPIRVEPSTRTVGVEAVDPGPAGNVPANSITVVPQGEDPSLTQVRNAAALSGGSRTEIALVSQADVDGALVALGERLPTAFDAILADPATTPPGMTLFAGTKRLEDPSPTEDPAAIVGREAASFELGLTSTGTVVAVDETPILAIADERLRTTVDGGHRLVAGSLEYETGEPEVDGERVRFPVTMRADQVAIVDAEELRASIKGLQVPRARSVLEAYGDVEIEVWPDWVTAIPTLDARLELVVVEVATIEPGASGSPSPAPSAAPATASPPAAPVGDP
jgi:hypothetical protein